LDILAIPNHIELGLVNNDMLDHSKKQVNVETTTELDRRKYLTLKTLQQP